MSEISSSGCGNGCGTSDERTESSDEDLPPQKKIAIETDSDEAIGASKPKLLKRKRGQIASQKRKDSSQQRRKRGSTKKGKQDTYKKRNESEPSTSQDNGYITL